MSSEGHTKPFLPVIMMGKGGRSSLLSLAGSPSV